VKQKMLIVRNPDYNPPCRPYEMANLTLDIILLARYLLVPGGRLVFFIPTITEEWDEVDLPVVEGMRELKCGSGSVQEFHSWGRRVSSPNSQRQKLII
jgi:tRNA (guanine10-N2)-methyltransferase